MENLWIEFKTKFWRKYFGLTPLSLPYVIHGNIYKYIVFGEKLGLKQNFKGSTLGYLDHSYVWSMGCLLVSCP